MTTNFEEEENENDIWFNSIFPVENEKLIYGNWEDDIIWNVEEIKNISKPSSIDIKDVNVIIEDDVNHNTLSQENNRSLANVDVKKILQDKTDKNKTIISHIFDTKDPFNISNDIYYAPKSSEITSNFGTGRQILHSIPVVQLQVPYIPTFIGPNELRNYHRPPLEKYKTGPLSRSEFRGVLPLTKHIKKKAEEREQERLASGGGDFFFMRSNEDITGRDGVLVLLEFSEENPPLMNQVGMCSKIKNYYKRKTTIDQNPLNYKFGETTFAHTSPFLGIMTPGQSLQAIENNMYRAPIYEHYVAKTDFLIVRTRYNYYIREIDALFIAGQQCPLYEVPEPNSKIIKTFLRDFLQVFIFRLFNNSNDYPKKIKIDEIKKAFPTMDESKIRNLLKSCADYKKTENSEHPDTNYWVMKSNFQLPTEEDIRSTISPEQCCAYYSMLASLQRLKDAGYGEKLTFVTPNEDDEDAQLKIEDEIKAAPWNTTRAYIQAVNGKSLLQITGPADPTGCGEGFSYVKVTNRSNTIKDEKKNHVYGTDADLRRLSLNKARAILRNYGLRDEEIKNLKRWELIDAVRKISTERAKAGEDGLIKFSRNNRSSSAEENQKRYKEECQWIFDLQNDVLASNEILSTTDDSTEDDCSDIEEMGKNIENLLSNKKTSSQICFEKEENEREELKKMMLSNDIRSEKKETNLSKNRVLKIHRTFCDDYGKETFYTEYVRNPAVIDAYVNIRNTMDDAFIKKFIGFDKNKNKQLVKRERRLIKDSNFKFNNFDNYDNTKIDTSSYQNRIENPSINKTIDTFKNQNLVDSNSLKFKKRKITISSDEQDDDHKASTDENRCKTDPHLIFLSLLKDIVTEMQRLPDVQSFISSLNIKLVPSSSHIFTRPMNLKILKDNIKQKKYQNRSDFLADVNQIVKNSRLYYGPNHLYSKSAEKLFQFCCNKLIENDDKLMRLELAIDSLLRDQNQERLSFILNSCIEKLKNMTEAFHFLKPVNKKLSKNYYKIVKRPIDLETISNNVENKIYYNRAEFMEDVQLILDNCLLFNNNSLFKEKAKKLVNAAKEFLSKYDEELVRVEKKIARTRKRVLKKAGIDVKESPVDDKNQKNYNKIVEIKSLESQINTQESKFASDCKVNSLEINEKKDLHHDQTYLNKNNILEEDLKFSSDDDSG